MDRYSRLAIISYLSQYYLNSRHQFEKLFLREVHHSQGYYYLAMAEMSVIIHVKYSTEVHHSAIPETIHFERINLQIFTL